MAVCKSKNSIKTRYSTIASLVLSNSHQMKERYEYKRNKYFK